MASLSPRAELIATIQGQASVLADQAGRDGLAEAQIGRRLMDSATMRLVALQMRKGAPDHLGAAFSDAADRMIEANDAADEDALYTARALRRDAKGAAL